MKFNKWILGLVAATAVFTACAVKAQTNSSALSVTQIESLLSNGFMQIGQPLNINGSSYLVNTNSTGGYTITVSSAAGSLSFTPPTTTQGALSQAQQWISENNPTNISFYGTNDLEISLSALYVQDGGNALISLSAAKYGLIKPLPQLAPEAELFQGTQNGKQSTAGADANILYRKPIGDVAVVAGAGGGYDNYSQKPLVDAKVEVEYRVNQHLGSFVGARYNYEGLKQASIATSLSGLIVGGGVRYSF